jgi:hypothetical protein
MEWRQRERNNDKKGKLEIDLKEKEKRYKKAKKGLDFKENCNNVAMFFFKI